MISSSEINDTVVGIKAFEERKRLLGMIKKREGKVSSMTKLRLASPKFPNRWTVI